MAEKRNSLFGWFGRQLGYMKGAVRKDVTPPEVVYKKTTVQESPLPDRPDEKLRRTVIDEVLRDPKKESETQNGIQ